MAKKKSLVQRKAVQPVKRKVVAAKTTAPAKKAPTQNKRPTGPTAAQQIAAIDEQIKALETKKATYKEQAVQDLKTRLVAANKVVRELENRLAGKTGKRKARR